jgi:hypothetical protein
MHLATMSAESANEDGEEATVFESSLIDDLNG